jgi:sulfide:quinone oxidoreductase
MWLFEERLRDEKIRDSASVEFWVPGFSMFGIKKYSDLLEELRVQRGVKGCFRNELIAVDGKKKLATFKSLNDGNKISVEKYNLLHAVPPMSSPEFIKKSPLADAAGWVDVDKYTLQSNKYSFVYGIGDCTSTPNSKTAAAITKQAPILVHNLCRTMKGEEPNAKYNGYASCPLIVSKNRVILAEFGYDGFFFFLKFKFINFFILICIFYCF